MTYIYTKVVQVPLAAEAGTLLRPIFRIVWYASIFGNGVIYSSSSTISITMSSTGSVSLTSTSVTVFGA